MHASVYDWAHRVIRPERAALRHARVLEFGSREVNGSLRGYLCWLGADPGEYVGVDIEDGPMVDVVDDCTRADLSLLDVSWDAVVCTEVLEHVRDWRAVVTNMKRAAREGGLIVMTTRGPGFHYHGYPHDYWRFTRDHARAAFADCEVLSLEDDPEIPGVFLLARRGAGAPTDLSRVEPAPAPEPE